MKTVIAGMGLSGFKTALEQRGEPGFRAAQVFAWVYKQGALDFTLMTNLPAALRARLEREFVVTDVSQRQAQGSRDGTRKFLLSLADGNLVEAVAIPTEKRLTGCISSQAGCKYACGFCASGKAGFKRDLSCAEIIGEVLHLRSALPDKELSHIVFMGTGEPLDNYDNVLAAARIINSPDAFGIGARRITLSTCGLVPAIRRLAGEGMQIELSVSLHAADDATRSRIMPVNRKYPLAQLIAACREYAAATRRQVTFEYILIEGINSDLQNARRLSTIMRDFNSKVNIIPFNPIAGQSWRAPESSRVRAFRDELLKAGVPVTVRTPRGQDIDAACGQLRLRHEKP